MSSKTAAATVSRLDTATVLRLFPETQRRQWPPGYLPASGVAHFLRPEGVPFADVIEAHKELKDMATCYDIQRDFASDYAIWARCTMTAFLNSCDARRRRRLRRWSARTRTLHDAEIRDVFGLEAYRPPAPPDTCHGSGSSSGSGPSSFKQMDGQQQQSQSRELYRFTPYAATQSYAMLPVSRAQSPEDTVHFTTFPQIRNVLYTDFDSVSPLRALCLHTGDDLVLSTELVQALAVYLRRRLDELLSSEDAFLKSALQPSDVDIRFSAETPILALFGNGRLSWAINNTELLPSHIRSVQLPPQAARRERRHREQRSEKAQALLATYDLSDALHHAFPTEVLSVGDALRTYKPAIVLVEPHVDRDWLADIRGFFSVREVLVMGTVDSPAMGSFAFPFLSFGVTPGPETYWAYSDNLQRVGGLSSSSQSSNNTLRMLPTDAPHVAQGYARHFIDDVSAYLISPNDCAAVGAQYRCLAFRRTNCPVVRPRSGTERGA